MIQTTIYGETSTKRINPDMADDRRVDEQTKELIRSGDKDVKIYVVKASTILEKEGSVFRGGNLFWSINKSSAIKGAKKLMEEEIKRMKSEGWK